MEFKAPDPAKVNGDTLLFKATHKDRLTGQVRLVHHRLRKRRRTLTSVDWVVLDYRYLSGERAELTDEEEARVELWCREQLPHPEHPQAPRRALRLKLALRDGRVVMVRMGRAECSGDVVVWEDEEGNVW